MRLSSRRVRGAPRLELLEPRTLLNASPLHHMGPPESHDPAMSILVRFLDHAPEAVQASLGGLGPAAHVVKTWDFGPQLIDLGVGADRAAALDMLHNDHNVLYAEPDALLHTTATPNDPLYPQQWGLSNTTSPGIDINAPRAWEVTTGNSNTIVAVVDTGIDYTHPDLYLNVAISQAAIPDTIGDLPKTGIVDTDGDSTDPNFDTNISFYDLNSLNADGTPYATPGINAAYTSKYTTDLYPYAAGYIHAGDLLADPNWTPNPGTNLVGYNFVAGTPNPFDDNSHGSHVSGTIAAVTNNGVGVAGVNWNAKIMPLKFLGASGSGSTSGAIDATVYAADNGARVINASFGGGGSSSAMRDAIIYAGSKGAVFVAAAGNSGQNIDVTPSYPASYHLPNEIVVAAIDIRGGLAGFSNYGATTVDLGAPGVGILSTTPNNTYSSYSGTSMAAPHVSGVVALVAGLPQFQNLSATELAQKVISTTKPLPSLAGKTVTGGLVDAFAALQSPPTTTTSTPAELATTSDAAVPAASGFESAPQVAGAPVILAAPLSAEATDLNRGTAPPLADPSHQSRRLRSATYLVGLPAGVVQ